MLGPPKPRRLDDPLAVCKLHRVMICAGLRSERQFIATASLNLAHCWRLGYALDEALPDHSSLTRIRQRWGVNICQRFVVALPLRGAGNWFHQAA
jgi:hypothetical protein